MKHKCHFPKQWLPFAVCKLKSNHIWKRLLTAAWTDNAFIYSAIPHTIDLSEFLSNWKIYYYFNQFKRREDISLQLLLNGVAIWSACEKVQIVRKVSKFSPQFSDHKRVALLNYQSCIIKHLFGQKNSWRSTDFSDELSHSTKRLHS